MAGAGDVLGGGSEFHRQRQFGDQCAGVRSEDMGAQHPVGGLVRQDFNEPIRAAHRPCSAVRGEREFAHIVGDTRGFQFFLGLTDGGDLGPCINHAGNDRVVHMPGLSGEAFGQGNPFVLGFVRQHRAGDGVADGVDAGHVGREMRVGFDAV
jgi:hypothetical protein